MSFGAQLVAQVLWLEGKIAFTGSIRWLSHGTAGIIRKFALSKVSLPGLWGRRDIRSSPVGSLSQADFSWGPHNTAQMPFIPRGEKPMLSCGVTVNEQADRYIKGQGVGIPIAHHQLQALLLPPSTALAFCLIDSQSPQHGQG